MNQEDRSQIAQLQARVAELERTLATLGEALVKTQQAQLKRDDQLDGVTAVLVGVAAMVAALPAFRESGAAGVRSAVEGYIASSLHSNATDAHLHGMSEWAYRLLPDIWKTS